MLNQRPLKRKKLSEMVEDELEKMIRHNEFCEGDTLPSERELMELFGVGRPSVREALAALKRKGLVRISNGEKARVTRPTPFTLIDELSGLAMDYLSRPEGTLHFEQFRLFFEISLVRYAAAHVTELQIEKLQRAIETGGLCLDNNNQFIRSDIAFHRILSEIPGNPIFVAIHTALIDWLIHKRPESYDTTLYERNMASHQQHLSIFGAICDGDADRAASELEKHLTPVISI
ncbi:transcriptional regulator NanR [Escherichia coli]|nr:transcriptional regulator NanR [Escherichia coli]EGJ4563760.1 transcriptional regulator NanR [Escherichia coli]EIH4818071.1 transcriptional regulator NanR [Escherichia coli]